MYGGSRCAADAAAAAAGKRWRRRRELAAAHFNAHPFVLAYVLACSCVLARYSQVPLALARNMVRAFASALLLSGSLAGAAAPPRPNFLVLFPDQWRHDWTPDNAALTNLSMPTWASLRARGTHFTKAFVPAPLCAPSRACLAGGREYDAAGVPDNFSNDYPVNQTTFMALLARAGYEVMTSGKDDLTKATGPSIDGSFHAAALGFTAYARCDGKDDATGATPHDPYGAYCAARWEIVGGKNETLFDVYNNDMHSCAKNGGSSGYDCAAASPMPQESYEDNYVANNAVALLKNKSKGTPWFLQVSFPGPHPPFVVTAGMMARTAGLAYPLAVDNKAMTADVQHIVRSDYAAELENLDTMFARVLAAIPADELANTFIIIASDHGEMLGDHDDWGKTMPWQGSVSVPLVVLGPGLPAGGATVGEPVGTMDIAGTVLELAGVAPAPNMTTVSLMPLLGGGAYRHFVSSGLGDWRAVAMKRPDGTHLKLVCCAAGKCPGQPRNDTSVFVGDSGEDAGRYAAATAGQRVHVPPRAAQKGNHTVLLFDIDADPYDMDDLSTTRRKAAQDMIALLPAGWCGSAGRGSNGATPNA